MNHLAVDPVVFVRVEYARHLAILAQTAQRFLDIVQTHMKNLGGLPSDDLLPTDLSHFRHSYDVELNVLHQMIQEKVGTYPGM